MYHDNPVVLSNPVLECLIRNDFLSRGKKVGSFMALPEEADLRLIHAYCLDKGIELSFPVLKDDEIIFIRVDDLSAMKENAFGIKEPVFEEKKKVEPDTFFVPGVGFDRRGNRLGFGKGHYDQYFAGIEYQSKTKIGVCQEGQVARCILKEDHDIMMDYVLTQRRLINTQEGLIFCIL